LNKPKYATSLDQAQPYGNTELWSLRRIAGQTFAVRQISL
jgi:hypothetical protein